MKQMYGNLIFTRDESNSRGDEIRFFFGSSKSLMLFNWNNNMLLQIGKIKLYQ